MGLSFRSGSGGLAGVWSLAGSADEALRVQGEGLVEDLPHGIRVVGEAPEEQARHRSVELGEQARSGAAAVDDPAARKRFAVGSGPR